MYQKMFARQQLKANNQLSKKLNHSHQSHPWTSTQYRSFATTVSEHTKPTVLRAVATEVDSTTGETIQEESSMSPGNTKPEVKANSKNTSDEKKDEKKNDNKNVEKNKETSSTPAGGGKPEVKLVNDVKDTSNHLKSETCGEESTEMSSNDVKTPIPKVISKERVKKAEEVIATLAEEGHKVKEKEPVAKSVIKERIRHIKNIVNDDGVVASS